MTMNKFFWLILLLGVTGINRAMAQIASFSFSGTPTTVAGWTNLPGDPHSGAQVATMAGITVSSISPANWVPNTVPSNVYNFGGASNATYFPAAVMANTWLQWNGNDNNLALYNASVPQLLLSGLNPDSTYILRMSGSDIYFQGSTQYTVAGASVSGSQYLDTYNNTTQGVTFTGIRPDVSGNIKIYVNAMSTSSWAFISGLQVFAGNAVNVGTPVVTLTAPVNGRVQSEGGNFIITATAAETGGSIAKVEFYADTTKIGEADTAPYTMTWVDPDPGNYELTAKATDAIGTIATTSVNVGVQSLNYFWSTTGNAATGGDTSFVGTVDSNRLAFRTKNIERMTISAIGNVGIGTDSPTAQLHTTGSVKFAGLTSDSTPSRIVVTDSTGKLYYQNIGGSGGLSPGPGLGGTSTGIALGDSIPGPGPHSFTSNRYEYLNGNQFSFGGSVNDPVNKPVLRMYDNGDLAVGTTMDTSVNTQYLSGMRYYNKLGILQIGATDRLDTTVSRYVYGNYQGSGILVNSDDPDSIKRIYCSVVAGDLINCDSSIYYSMVSGEGLTLHGHITKSLISGYSHSIAAGMTASLVTGQQNQSIAPMSDMMIGGYGNECIDTSIGSLICGTAIGFGGINQFSSGRWLVNKSPMGTVLGNDNVNFLSLPYSGLNGAQAPNLARYPLFVLGNGASIGNDITSNAITVLWNGRTQINTAGMTSTLSEAQVTPAAALDVVSTNTGVLLPRLTNAQRNAIVSGDLQNGLLLYNTDSSVFQYYNGTAWNSVGAGGAGTGGHWSYNSGAAFDSLDNVGIGTSNTQGYKLAVNGSAIATRMVVKPQSAWPDYVFNKEYRLPALDSLECYIREQHHLPGVAQAAEVAKNGIDLGEQQTLLLQKLEEHSLYLIDQNKRLTSQNEELNKQNARLEVQQEQLMRLASQVADLDKEINRLKQENETLKKNRKTNSH